MVRSSSFGKPKNLAQASPRETACETKFPVSSPGVKMRDWTWNRWKDTRHAGVGFRAFRTDLSRQRCRENPD